MEKKIVKNLPSSPGVYLFLKNKEILYIGKSINIKSRVASHLENAKVDTKESLIVNQATVIQYQLTESDFKAILLESSLIKKHQPKYNARLKDGKSNLYLKITIKDKYPKVFVCRQENDKKSLYFGPFSSQKITLELIREVRKIVPFCTQKKISKRACFYSKIGLCNPCPNEINYLQNNNLKKTLLKQYRQNIKNLLKILEGKENKVLEQLNYQLDQLTKEEKYEQAINIRNKIYRLKNLIGQKVFSESSDIESFLPEKSLTSLELLLNKYFSDIKKIIRIEAYDISHLAQTNITGSMVVFTNGIPNKNDYRRFRIRQLKKLSDLDQLKEIIVRRFNNDWPRPDLIVIDGGKPQIRTVIRTFKEIGLTIPTIGIAKNPDRLVIAKSDLPTVRLPLYHPGFNLVRAIRDESHRFAKKYHLLLRKKGVV